MGIAFVSRLRRPLGLLLAPAMLAACSGGLMPPDDIDGGGVSGHGRGVQDRVETLRAGFGADHQRFGRNADRDAQQRSGNGSL